MAKLIAYQFCLLQVVGYQLELGAYRFISNFFFFQKKIFPKTFFLSSRLPPIEPGGLPVQKVQKGLKKPGSRFNW